MKNKFKQFHQYQQRVQIYSIIEIESVYLGRIYWLWKESLNSDDHQFHQYQ